MLTTRTEYRSGLLRESYVRLLHSSGLPIYLFPKKLTTAYALFAARCGSMDTAFSLNGVAGSVPDGTAHFLEHKLFENPDGSDSFARFSELGADANAYTSYNRTAYLFSCTDRFDEALEELLTFVTHPHFTSASVRKERKIIAEEIRMYDDNPWERALLNLLSCLYHRHPVRKNICGTVSSIQKITPKTLSDYYRAFYRLSDMALVVVGDVSEEQLMRVANRVLPDAASNDAPLRRSLPTEPDTVRKSYLEARMPVSKPLFHIGIKDPVLLSDPDARFRRDLSMSLLNEILFSQSEEFYNTLFEEGLLTPSFSYGYSCADGCAFNCICGTSDNPQAVSERLWSYLSGIRRNGLSAESFERCRRTLYADELRAYDSTEEIANRLLSFVFDGVELFSPFEIYQSITKEELETLFCNLFCKDRSALSVVLPLEATEQKEVSSDAE